MHVLRRTPRPAPLRPRAGHPAHPARPGAGVDLPADVYPEHIEHCIVDAGDQRLYAAAAGPARGPLVLLLHGFPEMSCAWRR